MSEAELWSCCKAINHLKNNEQGAIKEVTQLRAELGRERLERLALDDELLRVQKLFKNVKAHAKEATGEAQSVSMAALVAKLERTEVSA